VETLRTLIWVGAAKDDLKALPPPVQRAMGFALYRVQQGRKPTTARPLHGFGGAGVLEIVEDFDGDAYRAIYTVRLATAVYVLHVFQKKSTHGIATPRRELELVRARLRQAELIDGKRQEEGQ
jgi:phage-related protein